MIIHDYDADTESVVNLEAFYGKPKKLVDKCLILFSDAIFRFLLSRYKCSEAGAAGSGGGRSIALTVTARRLPSIIPESDRRSQLKRAIRFTGRQGPPGLLCSVPAEAWTGRKPG